MKNIICFLKGHNLIVKPEHIDYGAILTNIPKEENVKKLRRYFIYCKRCERYLSLPLMEKQYD